MALNILSIPLRLPSWIISIVFARLITSIALNPNSVPNQRSIHLVKINKDEKDDIIVINLKRKPKVKWLNDFFLKCSNLFSFIPFISPHLRDRLFYHNANDIEYINNLLEEIDKLVTGQSTQQYCEQRSFDWSHIHFKGMEFLDAKMRVYFYEQLDKKYGPNAYNQERSNRINFFTVKTIDNAELDSVEVLGPDEEDKPIADRKFVITCLARDQNYINWIKDLTYTANVEATAICFNYRGIDLSRGLVWTEQDMINDVLAQTKRLIELGAKPENICIDGMCFGGSIATLAAEQLHSKNLKVKLNNERSFRSLPHLLFGYIAPEAHTVNWWNPLTYLRFLTAGLTFVILTPIFWLGGWYNNAEKAWNKIPVKDKIFSVVRDKKNKIYDGVINDDYSSIASVINGQLNVILKKLDKGMSLTEKENEFLTEYGEMNSEFIPTNQITLSEKYKGPHFVSRRDLVATLGHQEPYTNHDYFLKELQKKFPVNKPLEDTVLDRNCSPKVGMTSFPEKPFILACSGGGGHISAAKGIINQLQKNNPQVIITQHEAVLYKQHSFTFLSFFIRLGVMIASLPLIGSLANKIANLFGLPTLPDYKVFWEQMEKIKCSETQIVDGVAQGVERPYVDALLDLFPGGYEFTAYYNASYLSLSAKDTMSMSTYQNSVEGINGSTICNNVLIQLMRKAREGTPYTQFISTQALSLKSICNAVLYYNKFFLPQYNQAHKTCYPPITIAQYMTDLPSLGCAHFMDNLEGLSLEQRQLIELYAVYLSEPIKAAYFGANHGFKAVHDIDPKQNPMVRSGFHAEQLVDYTDLDKNHMLNYRVSTNDNSFGFVTKTIEVNAQQKVASIMIGSLASNASVDYIEDLLQAGYEHIFVFGGCNKNIYERIEKLIAKYPVEEQAKINQKIIRLENQTDVEMAPIFTRSNCLVIRGGGLSVMEQMALPLTKDKVILMHHEDSSDNNLTSGLSWEDSNTDRLIEYMAEKNVFSTKTSPKLCKNSLQYAEQFYATKYKEKTKSSVDVEAESNVDTASVTRTRVKTPSSLSASKSALNTYGFFTPQKNGLQHEEDNLVYLPSSLQAG